MNSRVELSEKEESFKKIILREESDALKNIDKPDDKLMVAKIVRLYEESKKNDN